MLHISAEELSENYSHNHQGKQGGQHAPEHTKIGSLIFFFEITLHKLCEEKLMFSDSRKHIGTLSLEFEIRRPRM